ncbi:CaiB/BaiF CoA-transferase family protein [Azospirillum sp. TSA6c]|uniref:CaiB/BaiF CoA transferase family protein n=1 Tax=unclassified Azospirillum TaxID=2630922 RepID=UPI000D61C31B|nr:CaiB/BaiF CoA-transferase family protein [Azospirillum sp. TSA6c]PWC47371.1 hypothetical protein TSA6c_12120 [Azospirillum sp. TSA6c]
MAGALDGLRVVDLSRVLGGPYCTQMLGDHGAEVIKVEPPQGDETRGWGPPFRDGTASYFLGANRNKRCIALDLSRPEGREVLMRLLESADVLVENFKVGTLEKWGIGYREVLAERFPQLIHCRVSGFGADGPLGGLAGYDAAVQAMSGLMSVNGEADGAPVRIGIPVVDLATGMNAAIAILLAVQERHRSGRGQFVEATLLDSALALAHPHTANWFLSGKPPKRTGSAHPNISPYDLFPTRTRPIFLAVGNDGQFARFCAAIGRPELSSDTRFATNRDRVVNRDALRAELEAALAARDGEAFAVELLEQGVPCGALLGVDEAVAQPHAVERGLTVAIGEYRGIASPATLSRTPASYRLAPGAFAADTVAVLRELGYGEAEIEALRVSGVAPGN